MLFIPEDQIAINIPLGDTRMMQPDLSIPGRKPTGPVKIDESNAFSRDLIHAWLTTEDLVSFSRKDFPAHFREYAVSAKRNNLPINQGNMLWFDNGDFPNNGQHIETGGPYPEFTVISVLQNFVDQGQFGQGHELILLDDPTDLNTARIYVDGGAGNFARVQMYQTTGTFEDDMGTDGGTFVGAFRTDGTTCFIRDPEGDAWGSDATNPPREYQRITLSSNAGNDGNLLGFEYIFIWTRCLSEAECETIIANPYQFIIPA